MANEIKDKFSSPTAFTITLASLGSSTSGTGRQSDLVDNSSTRYQDVIVYLKLTQGTSISGNKSLYCYGLRSDGTVADDGAGASDAGITLRNSPLLGIMSNSGSPSDGEVVYGVFTFNRPGPNFGIAIYHDTGTNLDSSGANFTCEWVGLNPEVQ